ncbi:MAG: SDR family oxidoreductase [Desulfobacteraceae bacterium]|jgi:3-oxoacyl-[acyl-carrier protein] reductase
MQKVLKTKVAIVTGASRGIGKEIALTLAEMGATLVIHYHQKKDLADKVAATIIKNGSKALAVQADIKHPADVQNLFDRTLDTYGAVDILVNNAGMMFNQKIEAVKEKDFDEIFATNVKGLFFACQQAARRMSDSGKIINISSTITRFMLPGYGAYAATKGAVDQLTKILAKELGIREITVNAIAPGPTDTELFREGKTNQQIKSMTETAALGRLGTPKDIAAAVALLVSPQAAWINGQTILVNGGYIA